MQGLVQFRYFDRIGQDEWVGGPRQLPKSADDDATPLKLTAIAVRKKQHRLNGIMFGDRWAGLKLDRDMAQDGNPYEPTLLARCRVPAQRAIMMLFVPQCSSARSLKSIVKNTFTPFPKGAPDLMERSTAHRSSRPLERGRPCCRGGTAAWKERGCRILVGSIRVPIGENFGGAKKDWRGASSKTRDGVCRGMICRKIGPHRRRN